MSDPCKRWVASARFEGVKKKNTANTPIITCGWPTREGEVDISCKRSG